MAGHSKWANIKHRKAAQDAKRGKIFTKLIRELTVAAREGGADPDSNPRLRSAIDKALTNNMKRDTVDNAIKRGVGDLDGAQMESVRYEGYGPGGVAVLVDTLTDNRNRTVAEVRNAFNKHGGNLGTEGSVAYLFSHQGVLAYPKSQEEALIEVALDAGAEDIQAEGDELLVLTTPTEFHAVKDKLVAAGLTPLRAEQTQLPATRVEVDELQAGQLLQLLDVLEDLDDVQDVHSNGDISDEILAKLEQL